MKTREQLAELRNVADRLSLSTPGERWLRATVIELITILVGDDVHHADLEMSGALFVAPAPKIWNPVQLQSQGQRPDIAPVSPQPGRALTIKEASDLAAARVPGNAKDAGTRAAAPPVATSAPPPPIVVEDATPDANVPDPARGFLDGLQAQLAEEDEQENHQP